MRILGINPARFLPWSPSPANAPPPPRHALIVSDIDDTLWPRLHLSDPLGRDRVPFECIRALQHTLRGTGRLHFVSARPKIWFLKVEKALENRAVDFFKVLYGDLLGSLLGLLGFGRWMMESKVRHIEALLAQKSLKTPAYFFGDMGQKDFDVALTLLKKTSGGAFDLVILKNVPRAARRDIPAAFKDKVYIVEDYVQAATVFLTKNLITEQEFKKILADRDYQLLLSRLTGVGRGVVMAKGP